MAPAALYLIPNRISESRDPRETIPEGTLSALRRCRRFLAENARSARAFLKAAGHPGPISDLEIIEIGHEPDESLFDSWLEPVKIGTPTALVSESGCPGVADPGAGIVRRAGILGIPVKPLVGPCSILLALMASGMNGQRFRFVGYLPVEEPELTAALKKLEADSRAPETELCIETPYRSNRLLSAMVSAFSGGTWITVAVDLTGEAESVRTMTASEWKKHLGTLPKAPAVFAVMAGGRVRRETGLLGRGGEARPRGRPPRQGCGQAPARRPRGPKG